MMQKYYDYCSLLDEWRKTLNIFSKVSNFPWCTFRKWALVAAMKWIQSSNIKKYEIHQRESLLLSYGWDHCIWLAHFELNETDDIHNGNTMYNVEHPIAGIHRSKSKWKERNHFSFLVRHENGKRIGIIEWNR